MGGGELGTEVWSVGCMFCCFVLCNAQRPPFGSALLIFAATSRPATLQLTPLHQQAAQVLVVPDLGLHQPCVFTCCSCSDNDLATLPASLVHCASLTRLTLSGNWQLHGLPPLSADLPSLRHLDASGTGLVTLPSWLSELRGLSELLLASNDMQVRPS